MSAGAEAAFRGAYEAMLRLWPAPPEGRDVPTLGGTTRVQVWGRADAPPLLLLHGFKVTSTMWGPNAAALGQVRRVYAADTLGDFGLSRADQPPRDLAGLQAWIDALLAGLGLDGPIDIGGMSYGGWLSAHFAARRPDRVRKLVLIAPGASFGSFSLAFVMRGMPMIVWNKRSFVDAYLRWAAVPPPNDAAYEAYLAALVDVMYTGLKHFGSTGPLPLPKKLPPAVMRAIAAPTLLLYGESEKMYSAAAAVEVARAHVSKLEPHVIAQASHDLTFARPAEVNAHIVRFLG